MTPPLILTFSGLDPCGGAGIAADVRAMARAGAHCLPLVTSLSSQNTQRSFSVRPVATDTLREQLEILLRDVKPDAIKIGLVADPDTARLIRQTCEQLPEVPVIADPVLRAGGGGELAGSDMVPCWREQLLPVTTLATPNEDEFERLYPGGDAGSLRDGQCLLVTGTDRGTDPISHRLLTSAGLVKTFQTPRLPHAYHGSGCLLAAAIAARLGRKQPLESAIADALMQTLATLRTAFQPGNGQWITG